MKIIKDDNVRIQITIAKKIIQNSTTKIVKSKTVSVMGVEFDDVYNFIVKSLESKERKESSLLGKIKKGIEGEIEKEKKRIEQQRRLTKRPRQKEWW